MSIKTLYEFKKYFNKRLLTVFLLGFSSGLPLALSGSTLQAWFAKEGVDIVTIGLLGLVGQPYAYKYLWSPIMDRFVPPFLGRRRGWMVITQIFIVVVLVMMGSLDVKTMPYQIGILALGLAFLSASQDIAIDAYRVDILEEDERGLGAALGIEAYRIAMLVSGGGALILADFFGWQLTYIVMGIFMVVGILAAYFGPEPKDKNIKPPPTIEKAIVLPFVDFLSKKDSLLILVFIILYKLGDAFVGSFNQTFLIREMGLSLTVVGSIMKSVGLFSILLGVFLGGLIMTKVKLFKALMTFGLLQAFSNLALVYLALTGPNYYMIIFVQFLEGICGGMGTAAFVAYLMSLCNPKYTATQYALLSSLTAIGRVFVGPVSGIMVKNIGWVQFYWFTFFIAFPGLLILWFLRDSLNKADELKLKKEMSVA